MTGANLYKACLKGDLRQPGLMIRMRPAMHQHDGQRVEPVFAQRQQIGPYRRLVQRMQHFAIRRHTLGNLDHPFRQLFGQNDVTRKNFRPRLCADP